MKQDADAIEQLQLRARWNMAAPGWAMLLAAAPLLWLVIATPGQAALPGPQFLFLHTAVELFCVVVAVLVFLTGYHALAVVLHLGQFIGLQAVMELLGYFQRRHAPGLALPDV